jgi:hypothetical protein
VGHAQTAQYSRVVLNIDEYAAMEAVFRTPGFRGINGAERSGHRYLAVADADAIEVASISAHSRLYEWRRPDPAKACSIARPGNAIEASVGKHGSAAIEANIVSV